MKVTVVGAGYVGLLSGTCLANRQYVLAAARSIGNPPTDHKGLVEKSKVPVGTADVELIKQRPKQPFIVDNRNLYAPALVRAMGLECPPIGR